MFDNGVNMKKRAVKKKISYFEASHEDSVFRFGFAEQNAFAIRAKKIHQILQLHSAIDVYPAQKMKERNIGCSTSSNEHASEYPIPVFSVIRKGRTLRSCIKSALEYLDGKQFRGLYCVKYAIIIGGICDLTSINRGGGAKILDYQHNHSD